MQPQKPFSESGTSPPRPVTVTRVETPGVAVGIGRAVGPDGREIPFLADLRTLLVLGEEIVAGRQVQVWLHGGQIISWDSERRS